MTYTLGDALRQMALTQVPRLGDWNLDRLAEMADELQRVNDDLENQIHEDGGFIEQVVDFEEEIRRLKDVVRQWERAHDIQRTRAVNAEKIISDNYTQRLL